MANQHRTTSLKDFKAWTAQFIIPCFPNFESEVLRDGLVKFAKCAGNAGPSENDYRTVFVVIEIDLLRMLGEANAARKSEIGMRCIEFLLQRIAIINARERGEAAVINLCSRMLER